MYWSNKIMNVLVQKGLKVLVQKNECIGPKNECDGPKKLMCWSKIMNVMVQMAAGCVGCRGALMFNVRPVEALISHNIFYGQFSVASGSFLV